jgi:hypothetical protein
MAQAKKEVEVRFRNSQAFVRNDGESAPAVDAVGFEIGVDCEDPGDRFAPRQVDKSCVGEIHRVIGISRHKQVQMRKVIVADCAQDDCFGPKESPHNSMIDALGTGQMKELGQHSSGSHQRGVQLGIGMPACVVPRILPIEIRDDRARITEAASDHVSLPGAR